MQENIKNWFKKNETSKFISSMYCLFVLSAVFDWLDEDARYFFGVIVPLCVGASIGILIYWLWRHKSHVVPWKYSLAFAILNIGIMCVTNYVYEALHYRFILFVIVMIFISQFPIWSKKSELTMEQAHDGLQGCDPLLDIVVSKPIYSTIISIIIVITILIFVGYNLL